MLDLMTPIGRGARLIVAPPRTGDYAASNRASSCRTTRRFLPDVLLIDELPEGDRQSRSVRARSLVDVDDRPATAGAEMVIESQAAVEHKKEC